MFPGDILLEVFDFCCLEASEDENFYDWWHVLVHVCQSWRQLIFTSPRRLNVQLLCTCETPVRKKLDCWPQIPIAIVDCCVGNLNRTKEDNLLTAFEHSDRVCSVKLTLSLKVPQLERVFKMMLKPFPVLTCLRVDLFNVWTIPGQPSGFLGGLTLSLQELYLNHISLPALPSILSSTSGLVDLHLCQLSKIDQVSPEVMATSLAAMTKLKSFTIEFKSYHGRPLPVQNFGTRATLPSLTQFQFEGNDGYLEDLVAQLDTPQLFDLTVMILDISGQSVYQQFPQLFQFVDRAEDLKLAQFRYAHVKIHSFHSFVHFYNPQTGQGLIHLTLGQAHSCVREPQFHGQLRPMEALLSQFSAIISNVQHLSITPLHEKIIWEALFDSAEWLRIFRLFNSVETLCAGRPFPRRFVPMLNGLSNELVTEVLPALRMLKIDGKPQKIVKKLLGPFIERRRSIGCPPLTIVKSHKVFERLQALGGTEGGTC